MYPTSNSSLLLWSLPHSSRPLHSMHISQNQPCRPILLMISSVTLARLCAYEWIYDIRGHNNNTDKSRLFYSSQDYQVMGIGNYLTVIDFQKETLPLLLSRPSSKSANFGVLDVIFENNKLRMPKLVKNMVASKKNHYSQPPRTGRRQSELGKDDREVIALFPWQYRYSKLAMNRAHTIGLFQSSKDESLIAPQLKKWLQRW